MKDYTGIITVILILIYMLLLTTNKCKNYFNGKTYTTCNESDPILLKMMSTENKQQQT